LPRQDVTSKEKFGKFGGKIMNTEKTHEIVHEVTGDIWYRGTYNACVKIWLEMPPHLTKIDGYGVACIDTGRYVSVVEK
jgi:hypothetical protein